MGDQRHLDDLKAFIRSKLRGHLVNDNDLKEATELLFKKSGGYFVYIASIAAMFEGDRKWTMAELECLPDGLDGVYRDYFARILEVKQKDVLYDVDKVSKWCGNVMTLMLMPGRFPCPPFVFSYTPVH